jgi:type IV pilus assembly protein PilB
MTFQLDKYLLDSKVITKEQLDKAAAEKARSNMSLLDELEYLKFADKASIIAGLEKHFKAKYVDLQANKLTQELLHLIPENIMKRHQVLAIRLDKAKNLLEIALADPNDVMAIDRVQAATGYEIEPFLTTEDDFRLAFDKYYLGVFAERMASKVIVEAPAEIMKEDVFAKISKDNKESLISQLFNTIVTQSIRARATDIHIEPQEKELLIRFRIDGLLETVQGLPRSVQPLLCTRIKVLALMDISETRLPQDGQIRLKAADHDLDLRVSTMPGLYGEKIAIRVLQKSSFSFGLSQLGMQPEIQSRFEDYIFRPNGMILVCGPTGSGKSTTLYATISRIRSPQKNILTIEDPVEYELLTGSAREGGVTQVQINPKINLTFAAGLRTFFRQDPDIIMVGEIRDRETAEIAINASMIGTLIFSSLHTKDSVNAATRLLNMGIEPYMVSNSVICILSQRLIRTLCPYCKQAYSVPKALLQKLGVKEENVTAFREVGCSKCDNKGYLGRIAIFELLGFSETIRDLVMRQASATELLAAARKEGFKTLAENALGFVLNGTTTVAEMLRVLPTSL